MKNQPHNQSGQIGIAILLIMVVLLTTGLSVASRSTEDLFLSQQQTESARVFNAAEAGIEEALSTEFEFDGDSATGTIDTFNDTQIDYEITKKNVLETLVFEGVSVKIDVDDSGTGAGLTANRDLDIEWSKETSCDTEDPASIVVAIFYDDAGTTRARYYAYEACDHNDGFDTSIGGSDPYFRQVTVPLVTGDLFVRVKPVYNDTHLRISGAGWTLPVQAYQITSEAQNELGAETRAVEVNKTLDAAPAILDYALYSGTTIVK